MQDGAPESRRPHRPHPHSSVPTPVSETPPPGGPSLQLPLHCHPHSLLEVSLSLCSHVNAELDFYSSHLSASVPVLRTSGPYLTQTLSMGRNHALPASTPPHRPAVVSAPMAVCPPWNCGPCVTVRPALPLRRPPCTRRPVLLCLCLGPESTQIQPARPETHGDT